MHIHQICIDNFKSFAEKTVIPFETGFTTVSGPNGSGKSNIVDSILFCLGLSTSRTMRAEKLSDLINNLSKRKEATVAITFRKDPNDLNREALQTRLPIEAPMPSPDVALIPEELAPENMPATNADVEISRSQLGPNSEFVQVSRRIKGTPSGYTSTYYLNGTVTTLTDIHEYLNQYNISPGTYNVMMQGDVAGIVNMSATERRKIVDEIAGVAEFDRKIDQACNELETTANNIERNAILLSEIDVRLSQLLTEREHALKYQGLKDERTRYEGMLLSAQYITLQQALSATQQNLQQARQQKDSTHVTLQTLLNSIGQTHAQLLDLSAQVKRKGEDQQIALKKQIEGLKGHIARKTDIITTAREKTDLAHQRIVQLQQEIERMADNAGQIDGEIEGFEYQLKELHDLHQNERTVFESLEKRFDALTGSSSELSLKRSEASKKVLSAEEALSRLQRDQLDSEAELKRVSYEKELRQRNQAEGSTKLSFLTQRHKNLVTENEDLTLERSAFEAQLRQLQVTHGETQGKLNEVQNRFQQFNRDYIQLEARQKAYEEVNFTRAVDTILRAGLPGVYGTVAQLGDVDQAYALALEIALGGRIQNIVVEDDQVASEGIQLLQQSKAGRATFLPLNKIQKAYPLPALPNVSGVVDFAINLIEFDGRYDAVFSYALGDTLIVEDAQSARNLLRKYRMVTLDGSLLEKSGAMTGGSQSHRNKGNFFGGNQTEQDLQRLAKQRDHATTEKEKLQHLLTATVLKQEKVNTDFVALMQRHSKVSAALEEVGSQLDELNKSYGQVDVSDLDQEANRLNQQIKVQSAALAEQAKLLSECQTALNAIESQLPSDQLDELREQIKEVRFQMEYYDTQIRNVQGEIKSKTMEKNYQHIGTSDCQERMTQTHSEIERLAKERQAAGEEIALTQVQVTELEAQTHNLDDELKKLQAERDIVQAQLIEQEKQKNGVERQLTQLEEQMQACYARQRELTPQLAQLKQRLESAGINPSEIEADTLPSSTEVEQRIAQLSQKMQKMEPVNMLAIDEYDKVSGRRNELSEKIDTLSQERETIQVKIASYQELKLLSFTKAFESIAHNFKTIFAELSDGEGQLMLTNPESPFEGGLTIHAQPRGKKMLRIEGLSGGEKSLTSLAFVFSIQRYMPAPFYALDEVDQNLDGINAERLAQMVGVEAKRAQFIVVSLRKPMIECSERTVGVTQRQNGITRVTGIKHRNEHTSHSTLAKPDTARQRQQTVKGGSIA
jgi:chromosome segregation protein